MQPKQKNLEQQLSNILQQAMLEILSPLHFTVKVTFIVLPPISNNGTKQYGRLAPSKFLIT
jgi:hypothetical protein